MQKISMRINSEELTISEAFQNYISKCKIRNLSLQTIKCYNEHYNIFSKYIGVDSKVIIINRDIVDDFIVYLKDNYRCNEITINSYLRSIRAFLYWLMEGGYLSRFNITMPKVFIKLING
jgi:integrase/recombinase XerD